MTVVVASVAPDGIVLASDSRTTQRRGLHHRVATNAAQKVYDAWGRIGLATYGTAMIGPDPIRGVVNAWLGEADAGASLADTAAGLAKYLQGRLSDATPATRGRELYDPAWPLGVLIAGYDESGAGRVLEARIWPLKQTVVDLEATTTKPSSLWRGQTTAIRRLILGIDDAEMKKVGIAITEEMKEPMRTMAYDIIQPTTVQDAVDLAHFLVETTIQMQRFSDGTYASPTEIPGCGGPTQCLAVTSDGTKWISELVLSAPAAERRRRGDGA
ncbi:MAG: hypothetical protein ACLPUT_18775 [Solirubrobacteraceae bacterium]